MPTPSQPEKKSPLSQSLPIAVLATILAGVVLFELVLFPSSEREIPYSEFKQLVLKKQVADLKIGANTIHGTLVDDALLPPADTRPASPPGPSALQRFTTYRVDDPALVTELENRLCVLLGGRVAEEIMFNNVSTGAQDDLQKATDIARSMVTEYGMSERLGLRTFEKERRGLFLDVPQLTRKDYNEEKAAEIDKEVEDILERTHQQVRDLLTAKQPLLEQLAQRLLEKEVLEGEEVRQMMRASESVPPQQLGVAV